MVADKVREYHDKQAKERKKAGGGDRKSSGAKIGCGNVTTTDPGRSRDAAGKAVGVSGSLVDRSCKVREPRFARLALLTPPQSCR